MPWSRRCLLEPLHQGARDAAATIAVKNEQAFDLAVAAVTVQQACGRAARE